MKRKAEVGRSIVPEHSEGLGEMPDLVKLELSRGTTRRKWTMRTFGIYALETAVALLASISTVQAADSVAAFYAGKTVYIVESSGPGGGYDIYARLIAQHLGKHIPGSPNVIIQYMPGAGGRKMASQLFAIGPYDGTVIGSFEQGIALDQATGGSEIDSTPRNFIG